MSISPTKTFYLLYVVNALSSLLWFSVRFFLGPYLNSFGFSGSEIGFFFALNSIAAICFLLPAGLFVDRFSPRKLILICSFGLIFISYFFSFANNFLLFSSLFFLLGGLYYSLRTSLNSELLKQVKDEHAGNEFGYFNSLAPFILGVGMIFSGFLIEKFPFKYVFIFQSIGFLLIFLLSFNFTKLKGIKINLTENIKELKKKKTVFFILVLALFASHWGAEETTYGLFLQKNLHLNSLQMGFYMSGELFFMAITALAVGISLQKGKMSMKKMFFWMLFLSGATHVLMTVEIVWFSALMRMIHGIGDGISGIFLFSGLKKFFNVERIGAQSGLVSLSMITGSFLGSLIYGPLGDNFGYQWPLIISGLISVLLIVFIQIFRED